MEDKDAEVVGFAAYVKGRWYLQGEHVDRIVEHEKTEMRKWIKQWFSSRSNNSN